MSVFGESTQNRLHGAWMEFKSIETSKWGVSWCVLKDNILFFFSSEKTSLETHIGTLHLTKDCKFQCTEGNARDGFRFELLVGKKKKKFRVRTVYERELWRAYIEGVITGSVPTGVILSPQDLQDVTYKLLNVHAATPAPDLGNMPPASSPLGLSPVMPAQARTLSASSSLNLSPTMVPPDAGRRGSVQSGETVSSGGSGKYGSHLGSGAVSLAGSTTSSQAGARQDMRRPPGPQLHNRPSFSSGSRDSGTGASDNMSDGGPTMTHKFVRNGTGPQPTWFFESCDRELAANILTSNPHLGNTLMRVSCTARSTGSYVISKRQHRTKQISHYEVIRVAEGYKINVDNCNQTAKTLTEVMEYFAQTAGRDSTNLLTCNDLDALGVQSDYSRSIARHPDIPAVASDEEAYEEPVNRVPSEHAPPPPASMTIPPPPPLTSSLSSSLASIPQAPPLSPTQLGRSPAHNLSHASTLPRPASAIFPSSTLSLASLPGSNARDRRSSDTDTAARFGPGAGRTTGTQGATGATGWRGSGTAQGAQGLNSQMQEQQTIRRLDDILSKEDSQSRGGTMSRPQLPPVPHDRPKLASLASSSGLEQVPAKTTPPPVVKPAGASRAQPPPVTQNTHAVSALTGRQSQGADSVMSELQQRLGQAGLRKTGIALVADAAQGHKDADADAAAQPVYTDARSALAPPAVPEDGQLYEDLEQYYQNM